MTVPHIDAAGPRVRAINHAHLPNGLRPVPGGLIVERFVTAGGEVEFDSASHHCITLHASEPVRGASSRHRFVYEPGDLSIWPAGLTDVWREERASEMVVVRVSPALLERATEESGHDSSRFSLSPRCQFRDPQLEHIAWALDAERAAGYPNGRLYLDSLGLAIAVHLIGHHATTQRLPRGLTRLQRQRLVEYIEAHLGETLTLAQLADVVGISASHLKVLFRRSIGMPVHAYVVQRRVERARALLLNSDLPLSQVALEVGFAHQSHLARWMRRLLGVTPAAFARRRCAG